VILVSNGPAAPPPPPPPAPPGGGWNPHSPHMPSGNLKFAITAWQNYVTPGSAEADFVAGHYDAIMAGPLPYLQQRNPTATIMPYALMWTVPPAGYSSPDLGSVYEWDMVQWYQQNPTCNIETAYLHVREPRTPANRHLTPIVPDNPWHNQHRYAQMNPTDPCFLRYTVDRFRRISQPAYATGIFIDIHDIHTLGWMDGSVEHSRESLREGIVNAWTQIGQQVDVPFFLNTATYDLGWTPGPLDHARGCGGGWGAHGELPDRAARRRPVGLHGRPAVTRRHGQGDDAHAPGQLAECVP